MMQTLPRLIPLLLAVGVACSGTGPGGEVVVRPCTPESLVSEGEPLPACSFDGVGDQPAVSLAQFEGAPLVVNFWASWCSACIREMPDIQRVHEDLGTRVTILGMNTLGVQGETEAAAERFADETGVRYPLAYDTDGMLYSHFGNVARPLMPLTVFADADGIVRHMNFGLIPEQTLRDLIEEHLGVG